MKWIVHHVFSVLSFQDYLVNILLKTARNEPCEAARYESDGGTEERYSRVEGMGLIGFMFTFQRNSIMK